MIERKTRAELMQSWKSPWASGSAASLAKLLMLCALISITFVPTADARFLSPDTWNPWLQGVDINRYAYSGNDPINGSDPNGHNSLTLGYEDYRSSSAFAEQMRRYQNGIVDGAVISAMIAGGMIETRDIWEWERTAAWQAQQAEEDEGKSKVSSSETTSDNSNNIDQTKTNSRRPSAETKRKADEKAKDKTGNLVCRHCGKNMTTEAGKKTSREFDHRTPYSKGGSSDEANIDSICRGCNRSKSDKSLSDWVKSILGIDR